jgi:hypothetical protein
MDSLSKVGLRTVGAEDEHSNYPRHHRFVAPSDCPLRRSVLSLWGYSPSWSRPFS